jgi:hypothetical protein
MKTPNEYEICLEGLLPDFWSDWFNGWVVHYDTESQTTTIGSVADQAALIGVLNKIQSLNLTVVSVKRTIDGG